MSNTTTTARPQGVPASLPVIERRAPVALRGPGLLSRRAGERLAAALAPVALLSLWELAVRMGALDVRFFPAPSQIVQTGGFARRS